MRQSRIQPRQLDGNINDQSLLTQTRDGHKLYVMLEPLESIYFVGLGL